MARWATVGTAVVISLVIASCAFSFLAAPEPRGPTSDQALSSTQRSGQLDTRAGRVAPSSIRATQVSKRIAPPPVTNLKVAKPISLDDEKCGWKPGDFLVGSCAGSGPKRTEASAKIKTAEECAALCCSMPTEHEDRTKLCISWQFRDDTGCRVGGDVRVGLEKDGVSSWCEHDPPALWYGQRVRIKDVTIDTACNAGWNMSALPTQCFGLGPRRVLKKETPEECRNWCCKNPKCTAWQFRPDKGCFAGRGGGNCDKYHAVSFQPWQGRRKLLKSRVYKPLRGGAARPKIP